MNARYRLNLEAPFLNAASYEDRPSRVRSLDRGTANDAPAHTETGTLRRPSPRNRAQGIDYTGETMARYISGLETRLAVHVKKHAPRWLEKEKHKILNRWSAPQPKLKPSWAPPPDREKDAREYARALLRERLKARMQRVADIRISRTLDGDTSGAPRRTLRMKA